MSVKSTLMSNQQFYALAYPKQNARYYLALVFSMLLFPLIAALLVAGTIFLIVPIIALVIWLGARTLFAHLVGNTVLVSTLNYPRIHGIVEELKVTMEFEKPIFVFVYESSSFNALLRFMFFRRAICLNSELLATGVSDNEVRWLVGRFIGYLRARHQAGVLGWIIRAAQNALIFNLFLLPYERAMVHTGDRLAVAAMEGDVSSAVSAMQKLLVGRQLGYSLNPEGILEQQRRIKGTFFGFLARMMSPFPHVTSRYVDLIVFAKSFYPMQYEKFAAANPGLPDDLLELGAAHQPDSIPATIGTQPPRMQPHGWACAAGTIAAMLVITLILRNSVLSSDTASSRSSTALEAQDLAAESPASETLSLPPHVHLDAENKLEPDAGCRWVSDAPTDMQVVCE
jgi:hypothetical protein